MDDLAATAVAALAYEELLDRDPRWALSEGSRHFEEGSAVFQALREIARRLKDLGVPYAVVGGMALFQHGLRRFTEDIDILVTKADLKTIHEALEGRGYLPPFPISKHLRDTRLGVKIEFLTAGDYPGDGKEKPVSFPDPGAASFEADGIRYINLPKLVELKLASGMTNPNRLKDLSDVMELIKVLDLRANFGEGLDPFVRHKYGELWKQARKRYVAAARHSAGDLERMRRDGVTLEGDGGRTRLVTTDAEVAERYGLVEESEYWDRGADVAEEGPSGD